MKLLESAKLGNQTLKNRMVMAAMTRSRAGLNGIVGDMTALYYKQRASAGMMLTEAINISEDALGSPWTPGLFTKEQIDGWKTVTDAVHSVGGVIYAQLWHTGRVGHSIDRNGKLPSAPSAIAIEGMPHYTSQGPKDYETPRALSLQEVKQTILDYKQAAINAIEAGFDGVELHAANGYLPNQFLSDSANQRTDEYGGSIENRSRFVLEIMNELIDTVGGDRVGIKIGPFQPYGSIVFNDPVASYTYLIEELNKLDFAFVELMRKSPAFPLLPGYPEDDEVALFGALSKNPVIANCGYTRDSGEDVLNNGMAKFVSFGSSFLANPDLPKRFEVNAPLNEADRSTFFGGDEKGYIDYPFLDQEKLER